MVCESTTSLLRVGRIVERISHRQSHWTIEGRVAGTRTIATQVVGTAVVLLLLSQVISSSGVDLHRDGTIWRMQGEVYLRFCRSWGHSVRRFGRCGAVKQWGKG